jgi:DNA-binding winged helix-turn-helix (wHTH) protein/tetratricopeptide (TPR) repeat protein
MKISEILPRAGLGGQTTYNGRRLDCARGGLVDSQGNFTSLRSQSFRVLDLLASHEGEIVEKDLVFAEVWSGAAVTDDSLTQCIGDIRRALDDADRRVLETIPRKGFRLHRDAPGVKRKPIRGVLSGLGALAVCLMLGSAAIFSIEPQQREEIATLSLIRNAGTEALAAEVATALDTYPSVRRIAGDGRFDLVLSRSSPQRILAELLDTKTSSIILSMSIVVSDDSSQIAARGGELANAVASPSGTGAIAKAVFADVRDKSLGDLTNGECYLLYFIQRRGSSLPENLFSRSKACLEAIVARDPKNATALALLGAMLVDQYWGGTGLDDPRDIPELRRPLAEKALEYARSAEEAGMPPDADVHEAVAIVYYGNCMTDLLVAKVRRMLEFRRDDPGLLGPAGNHIAYAGAWEIGVPMALRAVDLAKANSDRWWYWAMGKNHWRKGEYEAALEAFMQGYEENYWHNELHLAYTLPFLGRQREAEEAARRLDALWPGFTRADARRTHLRWCFDEDFIGRMDEALAMAGVPDAAEITLK